MNVDQPEHEGSVLYQSAFRISTVGVGWTAVEPEAFQVKTPYVLVSGFVESVAAKASQEKAQFWSVGFVDCVDQLCEIAAG